MILFPSWMFLGENTNNSFLLGGNYNAMGSRFIAAIVCCSLCANYGKLWRINYIAVTLVSIITLILVNSMTSFASIMVYVMISLLPSLQLRKYATLSLSVVLVLFQLFVVFNGNGLHDNELAVYIVEDVLGKDITFTHRTDMWEQSLQYFVKSPIAGYGFLSYNWYVEHMVCWGIGPHNFILVILLYGGIILLSLYLFIIYYAFRSVFNHFDNQSMTLILGTVTIFFMMLMEVYPFFFVFIFLTLLYHYKELSPSFQKANI